MLKILTSRRLCSQIVRESRRTLKNVEVSPISPIALQYLYGDVPKVQNDLKPPEELEVSGVMPIRDIGQREQPVYPFAIYDTLEEAKESSPCTDKPRGRRGGRRSRVRTEQHMESMSTNDKEAKEDKVEAKDELFRHGSSDPKFPSSNIPCSGCGAHLHCQDSKMPGFVPLEIFSQIHKSASKLSKTQCQRCVLIKDYNIALKMNVSPEDYPKTFEHLKYKKAIVILVVDLMDFPGSVWPNILDLIGSDKRIILVGNKVDLLPQDSPNYLKRIRESMERTFVQKCKEGLDRKPVFLESILVSARTGYNVELLISKVFQHWREKADHLGGDVYLVGTTNVGKSSIFNLLLESDLCDVKALNRIDKATIAPVPGTTMNLLKFPIMRPEPSSLSLRYKRLKQDHQVINRSERERLSKLRKSKSMEYSFPFHPVGQTFTQKKDQTLSNITSTAFAIGSKASSMDSQPNLGFNPKLYQDSKWCHDTPGTVSEDQVINLFTQEEIMKVLPMLPIVPRTISLKVGQTLFLAGVARLDVLTGPDAEKWQNRPLVLTIFASDDLPVNIVETEEAEDFLNQALKSDILKVPSCHQNPQRLAEFPELQGREFELYGISDEESSCDIVLSSIGWLAVTTRVTLSYLVKAWTPGGKGIYLRDLAFLPYSVNLKGKKIRKTPYYGQSRIFIP